MTLKKWFIYALVGTGLLLISACNPSSEPAPEDNAEDPDNVTTSGPSEEDMTSVDTTLVNQDNDVIGTATLTEKPDGVHIKLEAEDLSAGKHGFHIHEKGVCEPADFKSAGGHFNPDDNKHGFDHSDGPHAGDMLNIEVDEDGTVDKEVINEMVTLKPNKPNSLRGGNGTSLMIHTKKDDYQSQPSGDAGKRAACAVIAK